MESNRFSKDELNVLQSLFDSCDEDRTGRIHINQLAGLLNKLGKNTDEIISITEAAVRVADQNEGQIKFEEFSHILEQLDSAVDIPFEGPDPKVVEFLRILEEYRVKCEEEGNYLEAGRAHKQLGILRKQEEKRQQKAVRARQISERQDVQLAHNMQFSDFNSAWDSYMEEYDNMAQTYIQQMTERHAMVLLEFQKQLRQELLAKPPKWSRELLDMRRKQHGCARSKAYAEAQKLKKVCDKIEENEKKEMESGQAIHFAKKEAKYRLHQQAELHALLKRIECRRKEHIKQRNLDSKRLLQRNRNVQAVLESKQAVESQRIFLDIRKNLLNNNLIVAQSQQYTGTDQASGQRNTKQAHKGEYNDYDNQEFFPQGNFHDEKEHFRMNENENSEEEL
mmetsp:Transcript_27426/g.26227  ORF Transcript_27426/g.26227 Transcript_27426/m.26227 type:complete len:394 (-) Transcript_27426:29-1210(-)|eukprot:CAMPEP_0119040248 /NCGR_PEP_ID=MMETSP1177-20130426/10112_1 /TAXON_ID=2985 /ORGANISM="Ochromonas sp, Strain CCMP1899" /LENGTH=393 /DNA_ID=CAMNT_0007005109 /DNA_START=94 /DNA_END=1275 /DNA_ORIENTATION=-